MSDKVKKKFKDTKIGGFLSSNAPQLFKTALSMAGGFLPDGGLLQNLSDKIKSSSELDSEKQQQAFSLLEMDVKDRESARQLQIAALGQSDLFSKRFVYYFAMGIAGFTMVIVVFLFFTEVPESNQRVLDMLLGAFMSGLISIITFFFGSSQGSKDKEETLRKGKAK